MLVADDRRAAAHGDAQRHPGQAMVLEHEHLEAVVELGALEAPLLDHGRVPGGRRRQLPGRRVGAGHQQQQDEGPSHPLFPAGRGTTCTTVRFSWRR